MATQLLKSPQRPDGANQEYFNLLMDPQKGSAALQGL